MAATPAERRDQTVVPNLVGLDVHEARERGDGAGLVVVGPAPDGVPLGALTWPGRFVVVAQRPAAGSRVARGDMVVIEFRRQGGGDESGDREPRRPLPGLGRFAPGLQAPVAFPPALPAAWRAPGPAFAGPLARRPLAAWPPGGTGPGDAQAPKRRSRRA